MHLVWSQSEKVENHSQEENFATVKKNLKISNFDSYIRNF